ncbi:NAD(P)-dependent alcohol dehydrogenase [Nafulsella turpanensis]|uniref:NAD(P)-dependent alcohol dehydrogenase n=1 Tax=Nafulsella turpanensis TaxID=1265690 RepID=UPI00035FCA89|nr:NAD(P)-dependent alcohol dehydrogenase [Nafulsella turpanensis]
MKAAVIERYGPPYSLKIRQMPQPEIGTSELLVKVSASSVNPVDWKIRQGDLKIVTGNDFPKILGADFCGEVVAVGAGVSGYEKGDKVFGMERAVKGGAYAEYLKVKPSTLAPKPAKLSDEEAAALPLAGLTALQGLRDFGRLEKDDKVLINGASGGVGTFAVQIAKAMGAHVTGVCSTSKLEMVKLLGAEKVIDYTTEKVLKPEDKYHLIFDAHGNLSFGEAQKCLYDDGMLVTTLPSVKSILDIGFSKLQKHKQMKTFFITPNHADLMELKRLVDEGKLKVVIDKVYPLEELDLAHSYSETGHARGKIAISI